MVTFNVTSDCEGPVTDSATFTVTPPDPVEVTAPDNMTVGPCLNQTAVDAAFADWLDDVVYGGGCNPVLDDGSPSAPDYCGGSTMVTFNVTSDCEGPVIDTATFTVLAPDLLNYICPDDYVGSGETCSTDPVITGNVTVSGGCDPQVSYEDDFTPAPDTCGWNVTRTWTITDLCESYTCTQNISCICPETAWAYGGGYAEPNWDHADSNNWGWTNGLLPEGSYVWDLYAGAGQNDLLKGTKVGTVSVNYTIPCVNVTYSVIPGYYLGETHLWVGNDPLPEVTRGGHDPAYTDAPGQFPYGIDYGFDPADSGTWKTEWSWSSCDSDIEFEDDIYVAAHGVVWMEVECPEDGIVATVETDSSDSSDSSDSGDSSDSFWGWLFDWFQSFFRF